MVSFDDVTAERLRARGGFKWNSYPADVLPAFVADMDFELAPVIKEALVAQAESSACGYPKERAGLAGPLNALFARRMYERFGWRAEAEHVEVLSDVVQGLYVGVLAYAGREQGVIVQPPVYPPFFTAVRDNGRRLVDSPLTPAAGGSDFDLERLERRIDSHTRVLMLCNPHNPTGRVYTKGELLGLAELVVRHDLVVLADEIHADLTFDGHRHVPFASLGPEVLARTVTLTSASKAFNIPGLCCAVAHFGSASLRRRFLTVPAHLRGPASNAGLVAMYAAWTGGDPWLSELIDYLAGNRQRVGEWVNEHLPSATYRAPEGTYLAWVDTHEPKLGDAAGFFLEHGRVALSAGPSFGGPPTAFRLNFATSRRMLDAVLDRMAAALRRHESA